MAATRCWNCFNYKRLELTNRSIKDLEESLKRRFENYEVVIDHFKSRAKKRNGFEPQLHIWYCKENPNFTKIIYGEDTARKIKMPRCKFRDI